MSNSAHLIDQEELMSYLDGELPIERATSVAAHLERCAECQALAADLRSISQQMMSWRVEAPSARFGEGMAAALKEHLETVPKSVGLVPSPSAPKSGRVHVRRWILGLAGGFAAVLALFAITMPSLFRSRQGVGRPQSASVSAYPYATGNATEGGYGVLDARLSAGHGGGGSEGPSSQADQHMTGPMIIRTAGLTLVTKDFDKTRAAAEVIIRRHQGYSAQINVTGQAGAARIMAATYRIPADQLDATLSELKALASVEQESQSGEEVTSQLIDLSARLSNAQNTENRLNDVLRQRTGKIGDILAVEEEISRVRGEIERMEAEQKHLKNQVQYSTLQFRLSEEYKADLGLPTSSTGRLLYNALVDGYRGGFDSAVGLLIFLLNYGPTILFWGLLLYIPSRFAWKRWRTTLLQSNRPAKNDA